MSSHTPKVDLPHYDRTKVTPGIVHIGLGNFHRAHMAVYLDDLFAKGLSQDWAILGAGVREGDARMRDALNQFVIRGVSSNIAFQAALMQNPRFLSGDFNTGLIAEQYPKGFNAADVPHDDPAMLVAVATAIHRQYLSRNASISGQMPGHEFVPGEDFVVLLGDDEYRAKALAAKGGWDVSFAGEVYEVRSNWQFGDPLYIGTISGQPICMQIERRGLVYRLFHWGVQADIQVMSARTAELKARMPMAR